MWNQCEMLYLWQLSSYDGVFAPISLQKCHDGWGVKAFNNATDSSFQCFINGGEGLMTLYKEVLMPINAIHSKRASINYVEKFWPHPPQRPLLTSLLHKADWHLTNPSPMLFNIVYRCLIGLLDVRNYFGTYCSCVYVVKWVWALGVAGGLSFGWTCEIYIDSLFNFGSRLNS